MMPHGTLWLLGAMLLACCMACKGGGEPATPPADSVADTLPTLEEQEPRASVTFILGEDRSQFNQYYTLANHYYRLSPTERTEAVVTGLTSLQEVLRYLQKHRPANGRPYGLVNLVSHGNEFVDMAMTVRRGGERTSAKSLREALRRRQLPELDSTLVDSLTVVFLHGCAVGRNQELLDQLALAFDGGHGVTVKASKHFEYYAYLAANKNPQSIRHYYAQVWYAFYHPDSTMTENDYVRQLSRRYPHDRVRWRKGLRCRFQQSPADFYHYSFEVPCTWDEVFDTPDQMPLVNSRSRRLGWIEEHEDFRQLMALSQVPEEYFQVKFFRRTYHVSDDSVAYGLHVRAKAGVICLIQPLTLPDSTTILPCPDNAPCPPYSLARTDIPYLPNPTDTSIFAFSHLP